MENDYISREAARDLMYHNQDALTEYDLNSIPAADVVPVRHGHWIEWAEFFGRETDKKNLGVFCSQCRLYADNGFDYCPNCGAKMDGGEKGET